MANNLFTSLESHIRDVEIVREPETFTSSEYAKAVGIGQTAAQNRLRLLEERGIVERCTVQQKRGGYVYPSPGWRYLGESAKKGQVVGDRGKRGATDRKVAPVVAEGGAANGGGSERGTNVRRASARSKVSAT